MLLCSVVSWLVGVDVLMLGGARDGDVAAELAALRARVAALEEEARAAQMARDAERVHEWEERVRERARAVKEARRCDAEATVQRRHSNDSRRAHRMRRAPCSSPPTLPAHPAPPNGLETARTHSAQS